MKNIKLLFILLFAVATSAKLAAQQSPAPSLKATYAKPANAAFQYGVHQFADTAEVDLKLYVSPIDSLFFERVRVVMWNDSLNSVVNDTAYIGDPHLSYKHKALKLSYPGLTERLYNGYVLLQDSSAITLDSLNLK